MSCSVSLALFFSIIPLLDTFIRCGSHIIHLAAKHFIEHVCPAPSRFKKQARKSTQPDENGEEDLNDVLSKVIALVNQVRLETTIRSMEHLPVG